VTAETGSAELFAELDAVVETLKGVDFRQATWCREWTAQDVAAHLAAGADEIGRHLQALVDGKPVPETRGLAEREEPLRRLPPDVLFATLESATERLKELLQRTVGHDDSVIAWAGRQVPIGFFRMHVRSEAALHRWDVLGDDEFGNRVLSDGALAAHAVSSLGPLLLLRGSASPREFTVRLRSPGEPDVVVARTNGSMQIRFADPDPAAGAIECDAAARLLLLWGRDPSPPQRIRVNVASADYVALRQALAGY
jgi:uncharacterized protein (TIGR03083 family)